MDFGNVTVSDQIIAVIDNICQKMGIAISWGNENIIPYLQVLCEKWIRYTIISSVIKVVLLCGLTFILFKLMMKYVKKHQEASWNEELPFFMALIFGLLLMTVSIVNILIVPSEIANILKCATFPELYIFEHLQGLLG